MIQRKRLFSFEIDTAVGAIRSRFGNRAVARASIDSTTESAFLLGGRRFLGSFAINRGRLGLSRINADK